MKKETDGYLIIKIQSPAYEMDRSPRKPMGALILKFIKSYIWSGRITKNTNECLGPKNLLSLTYGVEGSPNTNKCLGPKITKPYPQAQIILSPI